MDGERSSWISERRDVDAAESGSGSFHGGWPEGPRTAPDMGSHRVIHSDVRFRGLQWR